MDLYGIHTLSWEAYNEGGDLKNQVEAYREQYGCYPEVVIADRIYLTRDNRNWLKELGIRISGKPLGRPPDDESYYRKAKRREENRQRNHIEGKFGQGKNAYGLSNIRARRQDTSESWIAAIFFVMNLVKLARVADIFCFFFIVSIQRILQTKKDQKLIDNSQYYSELSGYPAPLPMLQLIR